VIVDVPLAATTVASPPVVIVATPSVPDAHVTDDDRFCELLSLYVPIAVNCCVNPFATVGFDGVTAIDTSVAAAAVSTDDP
jgi:hypothetical protein